MGKEYSIRINATGRFVKWCDDLWYETDSKSVERFTLDQAESIILQLKKHYVYSVTLLKNGVPIKKDTVVPETHKRKTILKLSSKRLKA